MTCYPKSRNRFLEMTVVDYLIIIVLLFALVQGLFKGVILEIFGLLALAAGLLAANRFYELMGTRFENIFPRGFTRDAAAFVTVFFLAWTAVKILGWVLNKSLGEGSLPILSRLLGGALGLAKSFLFISLMIYSAERAFPGNRITSPNFVTPYCLRTIDWLKDRTPFKLPELDSYWQQSRRG